MIKVNQTYSYTLDTDNNYTTTTDTTSYSKNFNTEFRKEVKNVYDEVFKKAGLGQFFDQVSLKITDPKGTSKYYGNSYINTDCLYKAMNVPNMGVDAECKQHANMMKLQVQQNYVQDVFVYAQREDIVNQSLKMNDSISVSGYYKIDNVKQVQQEEVGRVVDTDYDTLWSVVFTMDHYVKR